MPENEVYPLPRNAEEAKRLNTQHQVWTRVVGYHIHPAIKSKLPASPHIADVGTGTAAFLFDMAEQYPSATLDGFDISDKQFPPLLSNIKLHVHDLRQPFPAEFHNKYDLVHIRLLFTAIDPKEWSSTVSNLAALLRQGGAIQWIEPAGEFAYVGTKDHNVAQPSDPSCEPVYTAKLATEFVNHLADRCDMSRTLPELYKAAGLVNAVQDSIPSNRNLELGQALCGTTIGGMVGWQKSIANTPTAVRPLDEVEELAKKVQAERDLGMMLFYDVHVNVAFKPE